MKCVNTSELLTVLCVDIMRYCDVFWGYSLFVLCCYNEAIMSHSYVFWVTVCLYCVDIMSIEILMGYCLFILLRYNEA